MNRVIAALIFTGLLLFSAHALAKELPKRASCTIAQLAKHECRLMLFRAGPGKMCTRNGEYCEYTGGAADRVMRRAMRQSTERRPTGSFRVESWRAR
ncbi:MAG: hypothetical protein WC700_09140 [Gemmatimonadaceae bacterium]|jgi:hypothetical protein